MDNIQILDCTLRDGGYVNDWQFGDVNSKLITESIYGAGIDYCELGFIRHCDYKKDKMEFNNMSQISSIFKPSNVKLAAMVEIGYGYPVEKFPLRSECTVDLIRLVVWKHMINESLNYCSKLIEKGYDVCIQATRTEQYSYSEFAGFVRAFSKMLPKGIYIVDTFGLLTKDEFLKYVKIADDNIASNVCIGYHAHNNMQQAYSNSIALLETQVNHALMIDASIMGIGRGAGNLPLELIVKYLNDKFHTKYNESILYEVAEKYIRPIYNKSPWGYSIPYLLSAKYGRNPSYVQYLLNKGIDYMKMESIFSAMRNDGVGITFDKKMCDELIEKIR